MDKIIWCLCQKNGIEVIDANNNLSEAYIKKAENALASMREVTNEEWIIATAYYAMYLSIYAIMMKIGIKCEIHKCSIEFVRIFLDKYFSEEESSFLEKSLQARIDKQYYTNREVVDEQYREMIRRAPEFLIKAKNILMQMNEKEIKEIKEKVTQKQKTCQENKSMDKLFKNAKNIKPKHNLSAKQMDKLMEKETLKINKKGVQEQ